ncbi:MAG: FAD binding domain-containing protein [Planctomycetota bacterium]
MLVRVILPRPPARARGVFLKHARRRAVDLALVSAAALGWPDADEPSGFGFRLAIGAAAPTPIRVPEAEEILRERPLEEARKAVRTAVMDAVSPISDVRATAEYRRDAAGTLAVRAVTGVLAKLAGGGGS